MNIGRERSCDPRISLQTERTEGSQINVLDFKRADLTKLRGKVGSTAWMEILKGEKKFRRVA